MTIIKAGYRLTVNSWENDADYHQSITVDGLIKIQVEFLIKFLSLFTSDKYGNIYGEISDAKEEALIKEVNQVISLYRNNPNLERDFGNLLNVEEIDLDLDDIISLVGDYLDYSENYYTRVFDGYIVEYLPEDIHIEDVTEQFNVT